VARAAVRQAAELGRPPMVGEHEENEALSTVSSSVHFSSWAQVLIKSKSPSTDHTYSAQFEPAHHVQNMHMS